MIPSQAQKSKLIATEIFIYFMLMVGSFLAAFAIEIFLVPNNLIDGGIIGIAMICANIFGSNYLPLFAFLLNLPFMLLAYRYIGKFFLLHMFVAVLFFGLSIWGIQHLGHWEFIGDPLEVVVIGGSILGIGIGMIIRYGGCLDGTEILGIIINRRTGITVGQVVLFCNIFVFGAAGFLFKDWHPPLLSLITYMVVIKVMDAVIVGLDETKSVLIISSKSKQIADAIIHQLGLGLTVMYGRGGYSGDAREILYVICERLQLAELKELIQQEDPLAFIAIENLHEIANGNMAAGHAGPQKRIEKLMTSILGQKKNSH